MKNISRSMLLLCFAGISYASQEICGPTEVQLRARRVDRLTVGRSYSRQEIARNMDDSLVAWPSPSLLITRSVYFAPVPNANGQYRVSVLASAEYALLEGTGSSPIDPGEAAYQLTDTQGNKSWAKDVLTTDRIYAGASERGAVYAFVGNIPADKRVASCMPVHGDRICCAVLVNRTPIV